MDTRPKFVCSIRFLLAILCFFLNGIHYMHKVNISVGIVCMVNNGSRNSLLDNGTTLNTDKFENTTLEDFNQTQIVDDLTYGGVFGLKKSFNWSKNVQGIVLGVIFLGSLTSQIFAGWLSLLIGSKVVILISMWIASILTILSPFAASHSYYTLIAFRFVIGIAQGFVTSSLNVILAIWTPPLERSTILSISNSGALIGNALTFLISGFLCSATVFGGWASIFFLTGILGVIWCLLWTFLVTDSPKNHKCISNEEKLYILDKTSEYSVKTREKKKVEWKKILTSKAVISLIITNITSNFGVSIFIVCLPTYMNDILKFKITRNGELSSIPFLCCWLAIIVSGILSDKMIRSKRFSKVFVRKLFNSVGFVVPILTYIGLLFVGSNTKIIAVILILTNITFCGFQFGSGFLVNYAEIGGKLSGIIYGIASTLSNLSSLLAPFLMGVLTSNGNQDGWTYIFIIAIVVYIIGTLSFLFFAECEIQEWAKVQKEDTIEKADDTIPLKE